MVNVDLVLTVEPTPDTMVTLTTGERFIVQESVQDVVDRAVAYRQSIFPGTFPPKV